VALDEANSRRAVWLIHARCSRRRDVSMGCHAPGAGINAAAGTTRRCRRAPAASLVHGGWFAARHSRGRLGRLERIAEELATLIDRSGLDGPVVLVAASSGGFDVRILASDHTDRVTGLVLVDASHEDQTHDIPRLARWVPLLSSIGIFRLLDISFGPRPALLSPSVQKFVGATRFRATGYQAAADEIIHIRESASEVRTSRRTLPIPVVVVTGARGADATWQELQRDQVKLSERGCQIVAERSGHLVQIDQPQIIVNAVRGVIDGTRGGC
jgi:pimeloyl-ACP methyl ester carboxylesterase